MEGVDDDGRARAPGEESCDAADRARFRGVRVEDRWPHLADQAREAEDSQRIVERRDLARQARQRNDPGARLLCDVGHRLLAARDRARDERRVVAARC